MRKILILFLISLLVLPTFSQTENQLEELMAGLTESKEEDFNSMIEYLNDLLENPLSFRYLTREKLSFVLFLTSTQTEALIMCKDTAVDLPSWDDIFQLIRASPQQKEFLPAILLLQDSVKQEIRPKTKIRNKMIFTFWQNFEKSIGYNDDEPGFTGSPAGIRMRNQISGRDFSIKLIADSDPGESGLKEPDHLSAGIAVHPSRQPFNVFLGDYHLTMGQGLGMGTKPGFRSWSTDPNMQMRRSTGFSLHGGSDENRFLRGGAVSYEGEKIAARGFFSAKDLDVTLKSDGSEREYISGVYSSGLHRTELEISKKGNVFEEIVGFELDYAGRTLELGALLVDFNFSEEFRIPNKRGSSIGGFEYGDQARRYSFWFRRLVGRGMLVGEIAGSSTGAMAISTTYSRFFNKGLSYLLSYDRIGSSFFSIYTMTGTSLLKKEGKESGRLNILYQPRKKWGMQFDFQVSSNMKPALEIEGGADYHFKTRMYYDFETCRAETWIQHSPKKTNASFRLKDTYVEDDFSWQGEVGFSSNSFSNLFDQPGTYLSLRGKHLSLDGSLRVQSGISLFTGGNGSGVFYIYEPEVLYGMSLPVLSGTGSRVFLLLQFQAFDSLRIELKLSRLDYDDRREIGTGLDRIPHNHRTMLKGQVVIRGMGD